MRDEKHAPLYLVAAHSVCLTLRYCLPNCAYSRTCCRVSSSVANARVALAIGIAVPACCHSIYEDKFSKGLADRLFARMVSCSCSSDGLTCARNARAPALAGDDPPPPPALRHSGRSADSPEPSPLHRVALQAGACNAKSGT